LYFRLETVITLAVLKKKDIPLLFLLHLFVVAQIVLSKGWLFRIFPYRQAIGSAVFRE
jgi:hypothetical protein